MKRRDAFGFFANPFVVLADIMVCLVFIIALFLLATTVYSEEAAQFAQMQDKRDRLADSLTGQLRARGFETTRRIIAPGKYQVGNLLEVQSDGTLQRFRFLQHQMDFRPGSDEFASPRNASRLLAVLGTTLLQNRSSIKSIVIEGHAQVGEPDPWNLSQRRAEAVRREWAANGLLGDVLWSAPLPIVDFLRRAGRWDETRFHEWHREEYQARRVAANGGLGVLPEAWVITSGRGDSTRRGPVIEFKVEYTERDAPPLDEVVADLPSPLRNEAKRLNLFQEKPQ